ncbi:MAG: ATP-binding cassette domain-containing protein [Planctomycetaceae bacterium]|jgi:sodium transport system ATP-binding protein|nr:ATP-binding cassette domain-containing protein [Planctomycetaceae bacterium]
MITVENLTKTYDDFDRNGFTAVDSISFSARAGEIFALLGPNGAGKTTTLRILATMLKPTSGKATINGYDVATQSAEVRRQIGYVSSSAAIYDRMTGWEMVWHFGTLYDIPKNVLTRRAAELFERLEMRDTQNVLGAKMSSGMKQKVSIARALIHDPPILIFDEPTVGLDVLVARALLKTIEDLRNRGKCIIFSTHIMREVEKLCDRVAIMGYGKILANNTLEELRKSRQKDDMEEIFFELLEGVQRKEPSSKAGR